jgi:capsular exopolysaccharide synthesis family protein
MSVQKKLAPSAYPSTSPGDVISGLFAAAPAADAIDLRELGRRLWRRKGTIFGTAVTLSVLALLVIWQITPRYAADTYIMIEPRQQQVVDFTAVLSGLPADFETIESELEVIRSRGLMAKTIRKLRLDRDPEFNAGLRPPSALQSLFDIRRYVPEEWITAIFGSEEQTELSERQMAERLQERLTNILLGRLEVEVQGKSRVLKVSFESESPRTASDVVNTLADFYIVSQLDAKFEATDRANRWLAERIAELREKVDISERAVERFRQESGLIQGEGSTLAAQEISELNTQLVVERTKRVEAESRLYQAQRLLRSQGSADTALEVINSPLIQSLRSQESEVERRIADLSEELGSKHPKMIAVRAEIHDVRRKITGEVERIVGGLRSEVAVANARESTLLRALENLKVEAGRLNTADVRLRALQREGEANRSLLETFLLRSKETSSQESFQEADARVLSRAATPEQPSFPNKKLFLLLSIVLSFGVGLALALAIEQLDHGFRSMDQVATMLGVAPLGLVPALTGSWSATKSPETYVLRRPNSAYAESIRSLHTSLLLSNVDDPPKVIMIASSLPHEGKTAVSLSLAHLLASLGQKVVIVDCDLRRPRLHKSFGVSPQPGLIEYLSREAELEDVLCRHEASGAYLIPAGSPVLSPPDLLASENMRKLLAQLKQNYDSVIIDTAPTMAVSDTRVLSRFVDKTVFVVRWASTRREVATAALNQFREIGADVAGVLLTIVDAKKHAGYDFSDSGYYSGAIKKYYHG